MLKGTSLIGLTLLATCGGDRATPAIQVGVNAPLASGDGVDAGSPPSDSRVADAPLPADAPAPDAPIVDASPPSAPTCVVSVLSSTVTTAVAGWTVSCPAGGQALVIVQVGVGPTWGGWDSAVVDCGRPGAMELPLAPASGPMPWAVADTLEWPYTMDSLISHCGTQGAP